MADKKVAGRQSAKKALVKPSPPKKTALKPAGTKKAAEKKAIPAKPAKKPVVQLKEVKKAVKPAKAKPASVSNTQKTVTKKTASSPALKTPEGKKNAPAQKKPAIPTIKKHLPDAVIIGNSVQIGPASIPDPILDLLESMDNAALSGKRWLIAAGAILDKVDAKIYRDFLAGLEWDSPAGKTILKNLGTAKGGVTSKLPTKEIFAKGLKDAKCDPDSVRHLFECFRNCLCCCRCWPCRPWRFCKICCTHRILVGQGNGSFSWANKLDFLGPTVSVDLARKATINYAAVPGGTYTPIGHQTDPNAHAGVLAPNSHLSSALAHPNVFAPKVYDKTKCSGYATITEVKDGAAAANPNTAVIKNSPEGAADLQARFSLDGHAHSGYEAAGSSAAAVNAHNAAGSPHPGKFDPSGTASLEVNAHNVAANPHPGKFADAGHDHDADYAPLSGSANYAATSHEHTGYAAKFGTVIGDVQVGGSLGTCIFNIPAYNDFDPANGTCCASIWYIEAGGRSQCFFDSQTIEKVAGAMRIKITGLCEASGSQYDPFVAPWDSRLLKIFALVAFSK